MSTTELPTIENVAFSNTVAGNSTWKDWLGIVASIGCAIHCAAMPFVIAWLQALGLSFLADKAFHKWMALICFLIAIVAFVPGIRKHRNWIPVSIGAVGLALITFAAFGLAGECCSSCAAENTPVSELSDSIAGDAACACEECDHCESLATTEVSETVEASGAPNKGSDLLATLAPWITPFGGLMLVSAHLLNRRYGSPCSCCGAEAAPEALA